MALCIFDYQGSVVVRGRLLLGMLATCVCRQSLLEGSFMDLELVIISTWLQSCDVIVATNFGFLRTCEFSNLCRLLTSTGRDLLITFGRHLELNSKQATLVMSFSTISAAGVNKARCVNKQG